MRLRASVSLAPIAQSSITVCLSRPNRIELASVGLRSVRRCRLDICCAGKCRLPCVVASSVDRCLLSGSSSVATVETGLCANSPTMNRLRLRFPTTAAGTISSRGACTETTAGMSADSVSSCVGADSLLHTMGNCAIRLAFWSSSCQHKTTVLD